MSGEYRFTVGGDFGELLRAFDRLDQRAQQSGKAAGDALNQGILGAVTGIEERLQRLPRTAQGLSQELARLQRIQSRTTSGQGFDLLEARITKITDLIQGLSQRKLSINVDPGSIVALRSQLDALNTQLGKVAIGSESFKNLQREIRGVEQALSRASKAAQTFRPNLATSQGLQAELARLQRVQGRTTSAEGADRIQRQITFIQDQIDATNRKRLTVGADPRSIVALRAQLDALNTQLSRTAIGSEGFKALQRQIQGVERDLRRAGEAGGVAAKGIGLVQGAIGLIGGLTIGAAVTGFFRESTRQAIELETATRRLTNTLGPQGAGAALGFVRGISDQLGLSFRSLVGSYGRFTAAATAANVPLQQQQELFTAVSRAGQALGLSNDEVNGAFLALQQIASKGTVSMEELRQQLGERLPIALAATAKGLGISNQALIKMVETGQLSANKFFPAFTKGLNELTQGAQGMPTAAQSMQRFKNEWESLQAALGESVLPMIILQVNGLTAALKALREAGSAGNIARDLGFGQTGFGGLSEGAQELVGDVGKLQQKYNLTSKELSNLASEARKTAGVTRTPLFGTVSEDAENLKRYADALEQRAKAFRDRQKGGKTEVNKEAAALQTTREQMNEQIKAQRESNALYAQRVGASALEAEAHMIRLVTHGKVTQAQADKAMAGARLQALQEEVKGYDALIAKLQEAKVKGASEGTDKNLLAAQSARAQKVLEIAKLEADASAKEVQRRQDILQLAQDRLQIEQQRIGLEDQASKVALTRLQAQQGVAEALLNLQSAQSGLTQSLFAVDTARQNYAIQSAEQELQILRSRGAGTDVIRQQEERIASLRRGGETLARRALAAEINSAAQRFDLERRVLQLKQIQQLLEAQSARRAAQTNTLQQQQRLLELQGRLADPQNTAGQRQAISEQIALQRQAIGLAQQQEGAETNRIQALGVIFGLERRTLAAQQEATANGFRAQAATKGWERALDGPLQNLDAAAMATNGVAFAMQAVNAGFIQAAGQVVNIYTVVQSMVGDVNNAADAAGALAAGYADANTNAQALLGTLQRIASVPQARYAGGPVDPASSYRINELGQESLLTPGGSLSLIQAPANSMWRPPARGTVLPAGLTARLKDAGAFGRTMAPAAGGPRFGNLEREIAELKMEVRAWRQKDWNVQVRTPSAAGLLRSIGGR